MRLMRSRLSWLRPLNAHWFVLCLWLTLLGNAHAASAMTGSYWIDPTGQAPVSEVAALPEAALRPLEQRSFRLGTAALWLRIELPARPAGAAQYLVLDSSAFTDRASLFNTRPAETGKGSMPVTTCPWRSGPYRTGHPCLRSAPTHPRARCGCACRTTRRH